MKRRTRLQFRRTEVELQTVFLHALHAQTEWETSMRRYRLPPLDPLVAFEAAARHLSFTRAADELALTQSAVSRQIQTLEGALGVALFQRLHRALVLTEAGRELSAATTSVLQQLHNVAERVGARSQRRTVVVTTTPGFAGLWLIPRLGGFTAAHGDVDVRISATYQLADLERDGVDLAVRYCAQESVGSDAVKLFGESVMPLCSPALLADRSRPLDKPADLRHHVLLHSTTGGRTHTADWQLWLRAMGLEDLQPAGTLHFELYDQMIQAAVDGHGVVLGRLPLVTRLLKAGRLVAPFSRKVASPLGYHLLRSAASARKPEVQQFADWLRAEARESAAETATARGRGSSARADRARA
jgi:DNA-binding transcriptional LysR family regulator